MKRGRSVRRHGWICWGLIAGSWAAMMAAHYHALANLERLMAKIGLTFPPAGPPKRPPIALTAISCGLVALFLAACLSRRGRAWLRMRPRLSRPSVHGDVYLESFALRIGMASLGVVAFRFALDWTPLPYLGMLGSLLAVLYAFKRCRSVRVPLAEWGWRRGRGIRRELLIGALVGLFFTVVRYLPGAAFERLDTSLPLAESSLGILKSVIWAAVIEETLYRGMLYRYLRDRWQWPVAVVLSAAVFAAIHFPLFRWPTFASGVIFALLREWRGSLLAPIAAHAMGNSVVILVRSGALA